jgi:hypothetical protein
VIPVNTVVEFTMALGIMIVVDLTALEPNISSQPTAYGDG